MPPSKKRKPSPPTKKKKKKTTQRSKKRTQKKSGKGFRDLVIALVLMGVVVAAGVVYDHFKPQEPRSKQARSIAKEPKRPAKKEKQVKNGRDELADAIDRRRRAAMQAYEEPTVAEKEIKTKESAPRQPTSRAALPTPARGELPKLVIIIDDIASPADLEALQAIPLKLTPSLFPPSKFAAHTPQMARGLRHYMVHLPMQAGSEAGGAMPDTLQVGDSAEKMRRRVAALRRWFPNARYLNNHTGSVFTANYPALHTLYGLLKAQGFTFVDSRTSGRSQGVRVAREYGDPYLGRDVFIDNVQQFGAIRARLKEAVQKARRKGYAIAIGHPHPITFRTLKNALDILVDVKVVYMDELLQSIR
jgi:polysaccharide deacetylase 2 family uncharacterized protein YibQ